MGFYINWACFNFRSLFQFNQHWQASSIRICCESGSLSSLNSLLCLELFDTWLSWPVMILSKNFMVKVKSSMSDFESIWCNKNKSGSIVTTPDFSIVIILGRFTFMPYIHFNTILIKRYEYKFKFIHNVQKQIYIYIIQFRIRKKLKIFFAEKLNWFWDSIYLHLTSYFLWWFKIPENFLLSQILEILTHLYMSKIWQIINISILIFVSTCNQLTQSEPMEFSKNPVITFQNDQIEIQHYPDPLRVLMLVVGEILNIATLYHLGWFKYPTFAYLQPFQSSLFCLKFVILDTYQQQGRWKNSNS